MRAWSLLLLAATACSAYEDDFGPTPFLCGEAAPRCPIGYTCLEDNGRAVCYEEGGQSGDDSCGDDGGLEPNNALDMASATPVDTARTHVVSDLAICPGIDKDNFAVTLAATNENLEATVEMVGASLRASIVNANGIAIITAPEDSESPGMLHLRAQNLPAGMYFVQVAGPGSGLPAHHYNLTIAVTGP